MYLPMCNWPRRLYCDLNGIEIAFKIVHFVLKICTFGFYDYTYQRYIKNLLTKIKFNFFIYKQAMVIEMTNII